MAGTTNDQLLRRLDMISRQADLILERLGVIMSTQDSGAADFTTIEAGISQILANDAELKQFAENLTAAIAALKADPSSAQLQADLDKAAADLTSALADQSGAVASVGQLSDDNPAPSSAPGTPTTTTPGTSTPGTSTPGTSTPATSTP